MTYVVNVDGTPLMPCCNTIGRLLLKDGNAKVLRVTPFTIKLIRYPSTTYMQRLTLGVDAGSRVAGFGVIDDHGNVLCASEVDLRQDIGNKMDRRRAYRRNRRSRKCRHRQPRFDNRRNSVKTGRLQPTLVSKIHSHVKEIEFIKKILPISEMIIEVGTFDPHALKDPTVLLDPIKYQRGTLYGFANVKAFVLDRDDHACQHCHGRSRNPHLHVHHIIYREDGGSNDPENLLTLCKTCHDGVHDGSITLNARGKRKSTLNHATHQNIINKRLIEHYPEANTTFGYITKTDREALGLQKSHHVDAIVIASRDNPISMHDVPVLYKKCVSRGDYQRTKGVRSERCIPAGKILGFRKFDKVQYHNTICFIKGRKSTGYFTLMNITGKTIPFKPTPKTNLIQRLEARTTWIIEMVPDFSTTRRSWLSRAR